MQQRSATPPQQQSHSSQTHDHSISRQSAECSRVQRQRVQARASAAERVHDLMSLSQDSWCRSSSSPRGCVHSSDSGHVAIKVVAKALYG
jgi:hypothetical protein